MTKNNELWVKYLREAERRTSEKNIRKSAEGGGPEKAADKAQGPDGYPAEVFKNSGCQTGLVAQVFSRPDFSNPCLRLYRIPLDKSGKPQTRRCYHLSAF